MDDLVAYGSPPSEMLQKMCRESSREVKGPFCLLAKQEKEKPDPHHTAGARALEHDSYRPGARSVPWTGRVTVIRSVRQDEGRAPPSIFAAVWLSEMGFHSQKNSASFVLVLVSSISAVKKEY